MGADELRPLEVDDDDATDSHPDHEHLRAQVFDHWTCRYCDEPEPAPVNLAARFASFGPEVPYELVPALVRAGLVVWAFGYGDGVDDFTTLDVYDLDLWHLAGADWGPFRLDTTEEDA